MKSFLLAALASLAAAGPASAQPAPVTAPAGQAELSLWRLDCGALTVAQYGAFFNDAFDYPAGPKDVVASCYLIKHGDRYLLWDAGLPDALVGNPMTLPIGTMRMQRSVVDQLRQLNVRPEQIEYLGISHYHFDHVGQAPRFPGATLLIGRGDVGALLSTPPADADSAAALGHWLVGEGEKTELTADHDVFGAGGGTMIKLPGHTPGHYALLVRLASGPVLLSGDMYHFTEQVANRGVPPFNHNRADTLASMDRFDRIARNLGARVIIQHEPADVAKLPAFPQAAR